MSEIFDELFARRHNGLSLDTLRMSVRQLTLEEFTKLYYSVVFNREISQASTERRAFIATRNFVRFRQMVIISRAYGMFKEVVKKFMGDVTDEQIYKFHISDSDFQCVKCEWFWRYRNNDFVEDTEEEHKALYEHSDKIHTWIHSINSDKDFCDYITAYHLGEKKDYCGFKLDGKEYPITVDINFDYGKYCKVKNAMFEAYNKKRNQLKTKDEYINLRIDFYRDEEKKYGRLDSIETKELEKLNKQYNENWIAIRNLESEWRDFKAFDDKLQRAFEKEDKANLDKAEEIKLYPYLKEMYEVEEDDEFFKWEMIWKQRELYLA